jgi:hypothetical protein
MSSPKTLLELRTKIRKFSDCVGDTTTGRHTTAQINDMLNSSWQAMRAVVSGNTHLYLKPATATMTAGKLSPFSWGSVTLPADCARIYGFDLTVTATDVRTLLPGSFTERNEYVGLYGQGTGVPVIFFAYNIGVEVTTTVTPGKVAVLPAPSQAFSYNLWYLPSWTPITNDTYVFDGMEGWDDWVVWDVVLKLAAADNDMTATAQIATQEREKAQIRLTAGGSDFHQAGPVKRIDVMAIRKRNAATIYNRRP